jgi:hypothetical protein
VAPGAKHWLENNAPENHRMKADAPENHRLEAYATGVGGYGELKKGWVAALDEFKG